jgi:hypothetical protein
MPYQVTERLYVDAAGKVYTESELTERTEAVLLMSAGGELSDADAEKYGLSTTDEAEADDEDDDDTEAKAVAAPPANKARASSSTKA